MTISNNAIHQVLTRPLEGEQLKMVEEKLKEKLAEIQRRQLQKYKKELSQEAFEVAVQSSQSFINKIVKELMYKLKNNDDPLQDLRDLEMVFDL